jgi:uncharacterized protein
MKLRLSPEVSLPQDAVTQTFAVLGKRGSGKTNTAGVLTEQLVKAGLPVVYVDPIGVTWGLRHSRDGKAPGLPVIILGGEHADVPLEETGGVVIADFVIEHRQPAVLDLGLFSKGAQRRFMVDFAERLYLKNRDALHVMLDECDTFVPQRIDHGGERLVGAINDLVRKGRARGLGVTLISQRPALVSKDVLTQVETLVAHRMTGPQDRDAIERWIEHNADQSGTEVLASLQTLDDGEAWVWSPSWLKKLVRTRINLRDTFDSSATPKAGARAATPKHAAEVDLGELRVKLAATIEKAKSDDPRELRRRIVELEKQIKVGRPAETKVVEKPVLTDKQVEKLEMVTSKLDLATAELANVATDIRRGLHAVVEAQRVTVKVDSVSQKDILTRGKFAHVSAEPVEFRPEEGVSDLSKGQLAILQRVVHHGEITKSALITLTGYRRSTRDRLLQELRALGCVSERGGLVVSTDEGRRRCPTEDLPTGDRLMQWWLERLSEGQAAMLQAVASAHPNDVAREEAGGTIGYARSTRDRLLQELQAMQLVTTPRKGYVLASEKLFD